MFNTERIKKVAAVMDSEEIDALFVSASSDLEYLTGLTPIDDERFKGICIYSDGSFFALTPKLCLDEFKEDLGDDVDIFAWSDEEGPLKAISQAFAKYGVPGYLGVNDSVRASHILPVSEEHGLRLKNARRVVAAVRMHKSEEEIDLLRKNGSLADEVLKQMAAFIKPGLSEREVQAKLIEVYESLGGEDVGAGPSAGPNSALPHYNKFNGVIKRNDVLRLGFGARFKGYCSDTTRTFFIGEPTDEQRKVYAVVLEAWMAGQSVVKEGVRACDVDRAARGVIEKAGYGEFFPHRTGHGIGVAEHELPDISATDRTVLKKGMAFSIEPGIYLPGKFGVRIEDCVTITDKGAQSFTDFPRKLMVL